MKSIRAKITFIYGHIHPCRWIKITLSFKLQTPSSSCTFMHKPSSSKHMNLMSMSLWAWTILFGIFCWSIYNTFKISPCHVGMMRGNILLHVHGWNFINGLNVSMKFPTSWNVWMKLIPKKLWWMEINIFTKFSCQSSSLFKNGVKGKILRKKY
jgi:hypothetical protein